MLQTRTRSFWAYHLRIRHPTGLTFWTVKQGKSITSILLPICNCTFQKLQRYFYTSGASRSALLSAAERSILISAMSEFSAYMLFVFIYQVVTSLIRHGTAEYNYDSFNIVMFIEMFFTSVETAVGPILCLFLNNGLRERESYKSTFLGKS